MMPRSTAMSSSPLPVARPWTPPDADADLDSSWGREDISDKRSESIADSGYFGEADNQSQAPSEENCDLWSTFASPPLDLSSTPSNKATYLDPHDTLHDSGALGLGLQDRPYTPVQTFTPGHAPQYPYTPDSARISQDRSHTFDTKSPLPSMPWASSPPLNTIHTSPVQNALFSYMNSLERLIQTHEPTFEQMEYLIAQFEAMTSYLSAPESQSKQSDEHLFSEGDTGDTVDSGSQSMDLTQEEAAAYVAAVGEYITGVQQHAADMKTRLDEVKLLNDLNLELIADLNHQLREKDQQLREKEQTRTKKNERIESKKSNQRTRPGPMSFWGAVTEALDQVSELLYEW